MAPHKVLLVFAVLFGGGMLLGWGLQEALESGATPGVMQVLSIAGAVALVAILWRIGASRRRSDAAATPKANGHRAQRSVVLGCVVIVSACVLASLLARTGATPGPIRWLLPAVCIPIVMWLSDRALRSDAGRFVREVASRETWAEGGNTLLSEAILGFHADDPFEPRRYDVVDPHGEIVGSIDATARSTSEYTFVARDAGGIGFTVSARRLRGRWSATVSDGRGNQVGNLVQAPRPLHKLYVAGFAAAIVVLALVLAAPFVLSGDAVNEPAPAPLVYVGTVALVLAPVLGISLFTHRHVVAFRFICTDGTVGRFVPDPTEEVALHLDMVGEDGRCLARASRVWEEGLPRRLFAGASMVVGVDPEANTRARMIALAAPVVVGLVQPPGTGAARAGERVMNAWEAGGRAVEG